MTSRCQQKNVVDRPKLKYNKNVKCEQTKFGRWCMLYTVTGSPLNHETLNMLWIYSTLKNTREMSPEFLLINQGKNCSSYIVRVIVTLTRVICKNKKRLLDFQHQEHNVILKQQYCRAQTTIVAHGGIETAMTTFSMIKTALKNNTKIYFGLFQLLQKNKF